MLAAAMLHAQERETPSRILRRIQAAELEDDEMPTLPSPPASEYGQGNDSSLILKENGGNLSLKRNPNRRVLTPLANNSITQNRSNVSEASISKQSFGDGSVADVTDEKIRARNSPRSQPKSPARRRLLASSPARSPPGTASTASSSKTVRPNPRREAARRLPPGRAARAKEISFSTTTEGDNSSVNLRDTSTDLLDQSEATPAVRGQTRTNQIQQDQSTNLYFDSRDLSQLNDLDSGLPEDSVQNDSLQGISSAYEHRHSPRHNLDPPGEQQDRDTDNDLSHGAGQPGEASPSSAGQHLSNVATRKRPHPNTRRPSALKQESTPDSVDADEVHGHELSVVQEEEGGQAIGVVSELSSPGTGRRVPSAERRRAEIDFSIQSNGYGETPIKASYPHQRNDRRSASPAYGGSQVQSTPATTNATAAPSPGVSSRAYPDSYATPRPASNDADLERRKTHLLSTLRLTALRTTTKPRLKHGTPMPARRARSATPAGQLSASYEESSSEQDLTGSSSLSAGSSSQDLTTHPRGRGDTSLPLVGMGDSPAAKGRFDGAKLNGYLHTLNTHLTEENQHLVKSLEETARELERLRRKNAELSMATTGGTTNMTNMDTSTSEERERENGDRTREMLKGHQRTQADISRIRDHLDTSSGSQLGSSVNGKRADEANFELREQKTRLEVEGEAARKEAAEKEEEIQSLRKQLLEQQRRNEDEDVTTSMQVADLQRQVFSLQDELASARSDASTSSAELSRLRTELLDSAGRHNKAIADLQTRTDELLLSLEERDAELENADRALEEQNEQFAEKMRNLEEELCKVMEEQEEQLLAARTELRAVQGEKAGDERKCAELERQVEDGREQMQRLRAEKERLQEMLKDATSTATGTSDSHAEQALQLRIQQLQHEVERLDSALSAESAAYDELSKEVASTAHEQKQRLVAVQDELDSLRRKEAHLERKLSSQSTLLKETESALAEAERSASQAEGIIKELEAEVHDLKTALEEQEEENANKTAKGGEREEMQKQLDAAFREIGNLKHQLANPPVLLHSSPLQSTPTGASDGGNLSIDIKDLEIRSLNSRNHELETRVNQLKRQALGAGGANTPIKAGGVGERSLSAEKSVRFSEVEGMRTPKSASRMLDNLSFLDRTGSPNTTSGGAGNQTVAPLYNQIDLLSAQVEALRSSLHSANEAVDDKLTKLDRAGLSTVQLAKQLAEARERIKELEGRSSSDSAHRADPAGLAKLRDDRDRLSSELRAAHSQSQQLSNALHSLRSQHSTTAKQLDAQTSETKHARRSLERAQAQLEAREVEREAWRREREEVLSGVLALQDEVGRVKRDAREIGDDLRLARGGAAFAGESANALCTRTACQEAAQRQRLEAKGLLAMIRYLKQKFLRESFFRADLAHQKGYLGMLLSQKQKTIDATNTTLLRFGMPPPPVSSTDSSNRSRRADGSVRPTLKIVASAVLATTRMSRLSEEWKRQSAVKGALRDAYKQTRGKPFEP